MKRKTIISLVMLFAANIASAYTTTPSESLKVWFDPIDALNDGNTVTYMHVYENDNVDYTAFNMTFIIPKGLKIHMVKEGREMVEDIHLSERAASTHTISCNLLDDGETLRVIADSSRNDDFYPDDEDGNKIDLLFTIGLVAEESMLPGDYSIEMTGIKFVLANGDSCVPVDDHVFSTISVYKDSDTGIEPIDRNAIDGWCYDLLGRKIENPRAGMIVVYCGEKRLIR